MNLLVIISNDFQSSSFFSRQDKDMDLRQQQYSFAMEMVLGQHRHIMYIVM